jgi:lactate permease
MTLLALLPILSLLALLLFVKHPKTQKPLSVPMAGGISLAISLVVALGFFGMPWYSGLPIAVGKALWLAFFVSLIVWGALLLYHLVSDFGAINVINKNIERFVKDRFVAFVLLAWLFTGFLQGIAGFGVPAVIVTPILIALGFNPVKSLAAALLGHSWAVTFGSMGAAFFVISGLTGVPLEDLGIPVWIFNAIGILTTGIGVCWLSDGFKGVKKGLVYVVPVTLVMVIVQYFTIQFEMFALAGLNAALAGLVAMFLLYKLMARGKEEKGESGFYKDKLNLAQAVFPYALIFALLISFQLFDLLDAPDTPRNEQFRNKIGIAFDFPGWNYDEHNPSAVCSRSQVIHGRDSDGNPVIRHGVSPAPNFNRIRLFVHPFLVLLLASIAACIVYKRAGIWDKEKGRNAVRKTVQKGIPATLALLALGNMSLIMMDSGMSNKLAYAIATLVGPLFPLISPFFGVLASFLTGNNTNANILFGNFQYAVADRLGMSTAVMSAAQSISASVGVAIGPTLVLMAALASDQKDKVSDTLKTLIPIMLIIALVMGIANFALLNLGLYEEILKFLGRGG